MTKEELKKEAEEIAKRKISNFIPQQWGVSLIRTEPTWETVEGAPHFYLNSLAKMWQEGAEFGYNKANEWHYVSKEGHPNKDDIYLTIRKDGLHLGDFCQGGDGDIDCQSWCDYPSEEEIQDDSVIAWKEIVPPELPKESV